LDSYIIQAKAIHFPAGTGWEGQLHCVSDFTTLLT
jgi:hypothetical protein